VSNHLVIREREEGGEIFFKKDFASLYFLRHLQKFSMNEKYRLLLPAFWWRLLLQNPQLCF